MGDFNIISFKDKHFSDSVFVGEQPTDAPSLVDTKGYLPLRKQVERLVLAGAQLESFRKGFYDYDEDYNGDIITSPFDDPNFLPSTDVPLYEKDLASRLTSQGDNEGSDKALAKEEPKEEPVKSASDSAVVS